MYHRIARRKEIPSQRRPRHNACAISELGYLSQLELADASRCCAHALAHRGCMFILPEQFPPTMRRAASQGVTVRVRSLVLGSAAYLSLIGYGYYWALSERAKDPDDEAGKDSGPSGPLSAEERLAVFKRTAGSYESETSTEELVMGLRLLRRWMLRKAKGETLEVAGGTCRNISYYPSDARLTIVDAVDSMVVQTEKKLKSMRVAGVRYGVMDAEHLKFTDASFDTVVDTFGLCSFEDPVRALKEMRRVCKPGGRILLLEHGRSTYDWVNRILDKNVHRHIARWGCIYNRDPCELVEQAGLKLSTLSRFHFGTTYMMEIEAEEKQAEEKGSDVRGGYKGKRRL